MVELISLDNPYLSYLIMLSGQAILTSMHVKTGNIFSVRVFSTHEKRFEKVTCSPKNDTSLGKKHLMQERPGRRPKSAWLFIHPVPIDSFSRGQALALLVPCVQNSQLGWSGADKSIFSFDRLVRDLEA